MHSQTMELPAGDTPSQSYERALRHKAFYLAATIAQTYDLGQALVSQAAFAAFCRFDDLGLDEAALEVLTRFGLSLSYNDRHGLLQIMQEFGEIPQGSIQKRPTEIQ